MKFSADTLKAPDLLFYRWCAAWTGLLVYELLNMRSLLLFNVFLIIPWFTFKAAPRLLKYSGILVPVVFALNLPFALAKDSRLWLSLIPVLIPLGLMGLLPDQGLAPAADSNTPNN